MKIESKEINLNSKGEFDIIDLANEIKEFVKKSDIQEGIINIQILHTTAAILVNENEPLLLKDIKKHLENHASKNSEYLHNNLEIRTVNICEEECLNGHSHCRAIYLPSNVCLNIIKGQLQLGRWQNIMFIELDHDRPRKIQLQLIGQ